MKLAHIATTFDQSIKWALTEEILSDAAKFERLYREVIKAKPDAWKEVNGDASARDRAERVVKAQYAEREAYRALGIVLQYNVSNSGVYRTGITPQSVILGFDRESEQFPEDILIENELIVVPHRILTLDSLAQVQFDWSKASTNLDTRKLAEEMLERNFKALCVEVKPYKSL